MMDNNNVHIILKNYIGPCVNHFATVHVDYEAFGNLEFYLSINSLYSQEIIKVKIIWVS